jgi:hypothetical protein
MDTKDVGVSVADNIKNTILAIWTTSQYYFIVKASTLYHHIWQGAIEHIQYIPCDPVKTHHPENLVSQTIISGIPMVRPHQSAVDFDDL